MAQLRRLSVLTFVLGVACASDDPEAAPDTDTDASVEASSSGTTETPGTTTSGSGSTTGSTTDVAEETTAADSSSGAAEESSEASGSSSCQVWAITYDLTGSQLEISDTPLMAGDQVNTVQEPHDANTNIGPGEFVLHFEDIDGAPGGLASMVSYAMDIFFVVDGVTTVTTDISGSAGPEDCGVTQGLLQGGTVAWAPPQIVGYTSEGTVLCEGMLCGAGGLPDGEPVDMGGMTDQVVGEFVFADDLTGFTMDRVVIDMDNTSTQSWSYVGTETGRELVAAPACACQ